MGTRLLDPRFKYTPAAATDITATWRRFGFDPRDNQARRSGAVSRRQPSAGGLTISNTGAFSKSLGMTCR